MLQLGKQRDIGYKEEQQVLNYPKLFIRNHPQNKMELTSIVADIADLLKSFDQEKPVHKNFQPGIGPFGEPQLVKEISNRLNLLGPNYFTKTKRTPDLLINELWAVEFKIVRPFGDNGKEAENWSVNLLHPYPGNTSLIGDAMKLTKLAEYRKALFVVGFEHSNALISLDPLLCSFEAICDHVVGIQLGERIEERRPGLVHPEHQVLRCVSWEIC